jgi:mutator protein MutT
LPPEPFHCANCAFTFFFNPASAAAAFIARSDGRVLFLRRAQDPAKGRLGLPGGFIDYEETAEEAVRREVREEIGLELLTLSYLCSRPNQYPYREVTYRVLDFFFRAEIHGHAAPAALDEVESCEWLHPREMDPEDIAFRSVREALKFYLEAR